MSRHARGLGAAGAILLVLTAGAYASSHAGKWTVSVFDAAGLAYAHSIRSEGRDILAIVFSWAGSFPVLGTFAVLVAWRELRKGAGAKAFLVAASVLSAALMAHLAKVGFSRPRPELFEAVIAMPSDLSFPSAHAMQAAAFASALLLQAPARPTVAWWLAGAGFVVAVSASRVYLQVHYPSDVLAGLIAGILLAVSLGSFLLKREELT